MKSLSSFNHKKNAADQVGCGQTLGDADLLLGLRGDQN